MTRATTYQQRRWPETPLFQEIAARWCADQSRLLLDLVWRACDSLYELDLRQLPLRMSDEAKEGDVESSSIGPASTMQKAATSHSPSVISHRSLLVAKPVKAALLSRTSVFVWYNNPNCIWPLEGKIVTRETDCNAYVAEVENNFLTGRYATFSLEGAMLGYLLHGDPQKIARKYQPSSQCASEFLIPAFRSGPHKVSEHLRSGLPQRRDAERFHCHHLVLVIPTDGA